MHCGMSFGKACIRIMCGILGSCVSASAGGLADVPIRIDVVEYDVGAGVGEDGGSPCVKQLLDLYGNGQAKAVFSALFTPDGKREFMEERVVLIPTGIPQYSGSVPWIPNRMNYSRLILGTAVRLQGFNEDAACFKLERECVMGIGADRRLKSENAFAEPTFRKKRVDFDFDISHSSGCAIAGGGWKEDDASKVYYVVAVRQN